MARIQYSSIVSEVAGSVGSATFQRNAYGNTLRQKPRRSSSGMNKLYDYQKNFTLLSRSWASLSLADQNVWLQFNSYIRSRAKNNKASILSGQALFTQYNLVRLALGLSVLTTPNYVTLPAIDTTFTLTEDEGAWPLVSSVSINSSLYVLAIYVKAVTTSNVSEKKPYSVLLVPSSYDDTTFYLADAWLAAFGGTPSGAGVYEFEIWMYSKSSPVSTLLYKANIEPTS